MTKWIRNNPYALLALASLFWSGNHIVGRAIGGHVPPLGISTVRWLLPALALGLLGHGHIRRDWPVIRSHWRILLWLGVTGGALFTSLQYVGLQYTTALNVSVLNSLVPVLILVTSALIFRDRITLVQVGGIAMSLIGVLVIVAHGSVEALLHLSFNVGDLIILFNMAVFAIYAAYLRMRPQIHWMSFMFVFAVISGVMTLPFFIWESLSGIVFRFDWMTAGAVLYVSIFPSLIAFAAWNRGVELIGAARAGPFVHLVPIYTAVFGSTLLGETLAIFHVGGFILILAGVLAGFNSEDDTGAGRKLKSRPALFAGAKSFMVAACR